MNQIHGMHWATGQMELATQAPTPPITFDQKLTFLCETVRNMENWWVACKRDGRDEAAQVTAEALGRKRAALRGMLNQLVVVQ